MQSSPANRRAADLMERDRRRLELTGERAAALIGSRARRHAIAAWNTTGDVYSVRRAVRDVFVGNDRLEQPGIVPLLIDAMTAAHLAGRKRVELTAAPLFRSDDRLKLAGTAYDDALAFLRRRLLLNEAELDGIRRIYESEAIRVSEGIASQLGTRLQEVLIDTLQDGEGVRGGIKALKQAFISEGFAPEADYKLETIFRTQTQLAYSAGRENVLSDPAVQDILWGFQYVTVGDDRVRPAHAALDGITRPKDDPIWDRITPPCGWNCRCSKLEIFDHEKHAETPIPDGADADPGFQFNPGRMFRDVVARDWAAMKAADLVPA